MANVELNDELSRLGVARSSELAKEAGGASVGAKTPAGTATNVQAALDALMVALNDASEEQRQALVNLNSSIEQSNTAINRSISEIQQQLEDGGGGSSIETFISTRTLAAGMSAELPVAQITKSTLLYKLATGITQDTPKNVDVTLTIGGNVIYRAQGLAQSIDSTYPVFTEHTGNMVLTVANNSADSCDVSIKAMWSAL